MKGPVLQWYPAEGGLPTEDYLPVIWDELLQVRSFTFVARIMHDEIRTRKKVWDFLNISDSVTATVYQSRGFISRMKQGFILTESSFSANSTHMIFNFMKDDFFQLRFDELVEISLLPNITVRGLRPRNALRVLFRSVEYQPDPAMVSLVSEMGIVAAATGLLFGVPGAHEIQAVVMIGRMTCIDKRVATLTDGTENLIAPTPIKESAHGRLGGNIFLVCYTFGLHSLMWYMISRNVQFITGEETASRILFPSVDYGAVVLLFPGFIYYIVRSTYSYISGGLTVVLFCGLVAYMFGLYLMFRTLATRPTFLQRKFVETDPRVKVWWRLYLPKGVWAPYEVLRMYRCVFGELDPSSRVNQYAVFVMSGIIGAAAAYDPPTRTQCQGQFAGIALFFAVCFLFYLLQQPYRYAMQNIASAVTCACLVALTGILTTNDSSTRDNYRNALCAMFAVSVLRSFFTVFTIWREHEVRILAMLPPDERARRSRHWWNHDPGSRYWFQPDPSTQHWWNRDPNAQHWWNRDPNGQHWWTRDPNARHWWTRDPNARHWWTRDPNARHWWTRDRNASPARSWWTQRRRAAAGRTARRSEPPATGDAAPPS